MPSWKTESMRFRIPLPAYNLQSWLLLLLFQSLPHFFLALYSPTRQSSFFFRRRKTNLVLLLLLLIFICEFEGTGLCVWCQLQYSSVHTYGIISTFHISIYLCVCIIFLFLGLCIPISSCIALIHTTCIFLLTLLFFVKLLLF